MRLLIDANLSPRIATRLRDAGHDAVHVADIGMVGASDEFILTHAESSGRVIISADTDFGELTANLPAVATDLDAGAVVSIARGRLRVRPLSVRHD